MNYLRVYEHVPFARLIPIRCVHDKKPPRDANLRRGEAYSARMLHCRKHAVDELGKFSVEFAFLDRFSNRE